MKSQICDGRRLDFKKNQITIENTDTFTTKSGKVRTVPMHDEVMRILLKIQRERPAIGFVFSKPSGYKFAGTYISVIRFKKYVRWQSLTMNFISIR